MNVERPVGYVMTHYDMLMVALALTIPRLIYGLSSARRSISFFAMGLFFAKFASWEIRFVLIPAGVYAILVEGLMEHLETQRIERMLFFRDRGYKNPDKPEDGLRKFNTRDDSNGPAWPPTV